MPNYPEHWGHWAGTATYPPMEWVVGNIVTDQSKRIEELEQRIEDLERAPEAQRKRSRMA